MSQGRSLGVGWDRKGQGCHTVPVTQPPSHTADHQGPVWVSGAPGHCSSCRSALPRSSERKRDVSGVSPPCSGTCAALLRAAARAELGVPKEPAGSCCMSASPPVWGTVWAALTPPVAASHYRHQAVGDTAWRSVPVQGPAGGTGMSWALPVAKTTQTIRRQRGVAGTQHRGAETRAVTWRESGVGCAPVCWGSAGPILVCCTGAVLETAGTSVGAVLEQCWAHTGGQCWGSAGGLYWVYTGVP